MKEINLDEKQVNSLVAVLGLRKDLVLDALKKTEIEEIAETCEANNFEESLRAHFDAKTRFEEKAALRRALMLSRKMEEVIEICDMFMDIVHLDVYGDEVDLMIRRAAEISFNLEEQPASQCK